MADVVAKV